MVPGLVHTQTVFILEHLSTEWAADLQGVVGPLQMERQVAQLHSLTAYRACNHAYLLTTAHIPAHVYAHIHIR